MLGQRRALALQALALIAIEFHLVQRLRKVLPRVSQIRLLLLVLTLGLFNVRLQALTALHHLLDLGGGSALLCNKFRPLVDCRLLRLLRLGSLLFQLDARLQQITDPLFKLVGLRPFALEL